MVNIFTLVCAIGLLVCEIKEFQRLRKEKLEDRRRWFESMRESWRIEAEQLAIKNLRELEQELDQNRENERRKNESA